MNSDMQIGNPENLWLLVVIPLGLLATVYSAWAFHRAARLFSATSPRRGNARRWLSSGLVSACLALLTLALLDLRWDKAWQEVPQKGLEVIFALDVSRSMLAEDAAPNRLVRAKQQIKDILDEMAGDRVGLIAFAGEARQVVPLTSHYEDFRQALDTVGPHSVRRGGSRLGDAMTAAANGFLGKTNDHKAIVVFTDGEDQESQPVEVARKLFSKQGIRIFTVGLGDIDRGARIPETDARQGGFVEYAGEQVWSKMNGKILEQIASEAGAAYIPAGTKRVDMGDVYHRLLANVDPQDFETARINAFVPRFQWFALPALMLLVLEVWVSTWSPFRRGETTRRLPAAAADRATTQPAGAATTNKTHAAY